MTIDHDNNGANVVGLVKKLQHPLAKIRSRALDNTLLKLREGLVSGDQLLGAIPPLLASLTDATLELRALHVLELIVATATNVVLANLHQNAAAEWLQRASIGKPQEMQVAYEKLLHKIYGSSHVPIIPTIQTHSTQERPQPTTTATPLPVQSASDKEPAELLSRQQSHHSAQRSRHAITDVLESHGWKFAPVTLATVDEQYLFEFEVKLAIRTTTEDIVSICRQFRHELLRNFPPQIFLQRPQILQYLLQIVQQPLLHSGVEERSTLLMAEDQDSELLNRQLDISFGVNYFDELQSTTFSAKRGNITAAVFLASLRALESFISALRRSAKISLNPMHITYESEMLTDFFHEFDSRRTYYPRIQLAAVQKKAGGCSYDECENRVGEFSRSGIAYKMFMSVLPLVRSPIHPHLHMLNILHAALPDLREKRIIGDMVTTPSGLDKARLEHIFELLSETCLPVSSLSTYAQLQQVFTLSVMWKLVELIIQLLQIFPASCYRVKESNENGGNEWITVPQRLWDFLKICMSNAVFNEVVTKEWKNMDLIAYFTEIDDMIPFYLETKRRSLVDGQEVQAYVEFAKQNSSHISEFGHLEIPTSINLAASRKVVLAIDVLADIDGILIVDTVLQTFWAALRRRNDEQPGGVNALSEEDVQSMRAVVLWFTTLVSGKPSDRGVRKELSTHFFHHVPDLLSNQDPTLIRISSNVRRQFITSVLCDKVFLSYLLLVIASESKAHEESHSNDMDIDIYWRILAMIFDELAEASDEELDILHPVIPWLQHFAYMEPSKYTSALQKSVQPQLVKMINRTETQATNAERLMLIARCTLHQSPYIRKAAASGVLNILLKTTSFPSDKIKRDNFWQDPFGYSSSDEVQGHSIEAKLVETPFPADLNSNMDHTTNIEISSTLSKLSNLRKLLLRSSSALPDVQEAALKELAMVMESLSPTQVSLLEDVHEVNHMMNMAIEVLQLNHAKHLDIGSNIVQHTLTLIRNLLLRSITLRDSVRKDFDVLALLFLFMFDPRERVRVQLFYIILLLTCTLENFVLPDGLAEKSDVSCVGLAVIPDIMTQSFGLHSNRWDRCFIPMRSLNIILPEVTKLLCKDESSYWRQEVQAIVNTVHDGQKERDSYPLVNDHKFITETLRGAKSHGKFMNALYHLLQLCHGWKSVAQCVTHTWETEFEKYLTVSPKCERDEVIIGSIVSVINAVFEHMTRSEQLRVLIVCKRSFLPVLKRSQSNNLSLQIARLLLHVSVSKVSDLFLSLAVDTDIISWICSKYLTFYSTEPVLHSIMLELLLKFVVIKKQQPERRLASSYEVIHQHFSLLISPLLAVICRHRIPGSFLERDVFAVASQLLVSILQILPQNQENIDILEDSNWSSRLLFDHVSATRELGFATLLDYSSIKSNETRGRLLQLALDTALDETECDGVRSAACDVIRSTVSRYDLNSTDLQVQHNEILDGEHFAERVLKVLSRCLKGDTILLRSTYAFTRLVIELYIQRSVLAPQFGDIAAELTIGDEDYNVFSVLVQAVSYREWAAKCEDYCTRFMLVSLNDSDMWTQSLLPGVLECILGILSLFQVLIQRSKPELTNFLRMHTTLTYQLIELIEDIELSLRKMLPSAEDFAIETTPVVQAHYDVLECSAIVLSRLIVQSPESMERDNGNEDLQRPVFISRQLFVHILPVAVKLMEARHPLSFRISFSRLIAAIFLNQSKEQLQSADSEDVHSLCSAVFELFKIVSEFRALSLFSTETSNASASESSSIASVRRVACTLQLMLESVSTLRHLVVIKQGIQLCTMSIKELFYAIRMAGGFGGKTKNSNSSQDDYMLEICARIEIHMNVMSALVGDHPDHQKLAMLQQFPGILLSNWNTMKMAHIRGSAVLLSALRLLNNYTSRNDVTKASLLRSSSSLPLRSGAAVEESQQKPCSLLALLSDLAHQSSTATSLARLPSNSLKDSTICSVACVILKSTLLNAECLMWAIKSGLIAKLVNDIQERLKNIRQTSRPDPAEVENLGNLLGVLSSVACNDDGTQVIYSSSTKGLVYLLEDILCSAHASIHESGCLFIRNLSLSRISKTHFTVWENLLDELLALVRTSRSVVAKVHISCTLWALVYDNQKARAIVLGKPAALEHLEQVLATNAQPGEQQAEIIENLRHVLMLVRN